MLTNKALRNFELIPELLKILRDVIKTYKFLYINGKILYKDISENNIIITDLKKINGFTDILIIIKYNKENNNRKNSVR